MKIDSIDIRSFDAKQLTVDFEPPQTGVTVEMFDGALIPSESETYTPLSGTSWRAFLVNRLLLLRKQRGGTGEILPRNKKGGSEGLPSEVSGMTRIFHDDGNGRHIRHKQKKL